MNGFLYVFLLFIFAMATGVAADANAVGIAWACGFMTMIITFCGMMSYLGRNLR